MDGMLNNSGMSTENYSRTLIGWANSVAANNSAPAGITLGAAGRTYNDTAYVSGQTYNNAVAARAYLTGSPPSWSISDGGEVESPEGEEEESPDEGFVFVFTDTNQQLETAEGLLVQVPEEYANS